MIANTRSKFESEDVQSDLLRQQGGLSAKVNKNVNLVGQS